MTRPATLYDTLGVAPEATAAEIRAAYLRLARELHPDRLVGRPEAERERAERRMQDVTRAWSVLGDPDRRRAYDRRSAPPEARPTAARAATAPDPRPGAARVPDPDDDDDLVDVAPPGGCFGGVVLGGFVALLLLIGVVTAFARREPAGAPGPSPSTIRSVETARPGECVRFETAGLVLVPCDGAQDAVVVEVVSFPAPCPSRLDPVDLPGSDVQLCVEAGGAPPG